MKNEVQKSRLMEGLFLTKLKNQPHFCFMHKKVHPTSEVLNFSKNFVSHHPNEHAEFKNNVLIYDFYDRKYSLLYDL